jgi:NADPH:quinone reductase-like Zn-dependent oxidoreductase
MCIRGRAACDLAGEVAAVGGGVRGFELGNKVIAINFPVR